MKRINLLDFCVYAHYFGDRLVYIGAGKIERAFDLKGRTLQYENALRISGTLPSVEIWFTTSNRVEALKLETSYIRMFNPPLNMIGLSADPRKHAADRVRSLRIFGCVLCMETGIVYSTMRSAAKIMGLNPATIANHINGRDGYPDVRGWTFERRPDLKPNYKTGMDWRIPIYTE